MLILPIGRYAIALARMTQHRRIRRRRPGWYRQLRMRYFPYRRTSPLDGHLFKIGIPLGPFELQLWRSAKQH
jgi:hypothetical protein